jgi:hypothetical protein
MRRMLTKASLRLATVQPEDFTLSLTFNYETN